MHIAQAKTRYGLLMMAAAISGLLQQEISLGSELPIDWRGARSAGMGDAYTTGVNDETSVFYNPAGVARMRNPRSRNYVHQVDFPGLSLGGNSSAVLASKEAQRSPKTVVSELMQRAQENPGNPLYAEAQMFPNIVLGAKNGATYLIGLPIRTEQNIRVESTEKPDLVHLVSKSTAGVAIDVASASRGSLIAYGLSLRPNFRYNYDKQVTASEISSTKQLKTSAVEHAQRTTATPIDVGVILTAADFWFPSLGIAIRNIPTGCVPDYENPITGKRLTMCGTLRSGASTQAAAKEKVDPTEVRVGVSITPRIRIAGARWNLRLAGDMWPVPIQSGANSYGFSDLTVSEMLHAGMELSTGNALRGRGLMLRAGIHNNTMAWGGSVLLGVIGIEYASYTSSSGFDTVISNGTEAKTTARQSRLDRRHLLGLTTRW